MNCQERIDKAEPEAINTASFGSQVGPEGWTEIENNPNFTVLDPAFRTKTFVLSAFDELFRVRKTNPRPGITPVPCLHTLNILQSGKSALVSAVGEGIMDA